VDGGTFEPVDFACGHGGRSQPVVASSACPSPIHAAFRRLDAGGAHGRVRGGGAPAGAQGPRAAADVGGLLAGHVGPAALHSAPPARPGAGPGAGVRFPAAGPGGRPRRARGAVAERDPWYGKTLRLPSRLID